ncbi:MAG: DUF481 domain-containing protein [Opitutales bacterium]|nr:DUF481 domain-containing protein [Opitutales bacterium]
MIQGKRAILALVLALGALGMGHYAFAQEVKISLKNGDILRGLLIVEGDVIVIQHTLLGDIDIPKSSVKKLDRIVAREKKDTKLEDGQTSGSGPTRRWGREFIQALTFEPWSKEFEFGLNIQSGRKNREDFSLRYDMRRRIEKNDYRFLAQKYYGVSEGEKISDRALSSFRWRSDIAPGVFYQSDTLYSADVIKEIDLTLEQKFGLGYRFINGKNFKLSTGLGLNGRYRDDSRGNNTTYLVDLFEDIDYRLNQRFRITQEFSIALPPEDSNQYEIQFQTGVVSKITDSLHMSVRYQLDYDRSQPKDRRQNQRLVSSVGVDF